MILPDGRGQVPHNPEFDVSGYLQDRAEADPFLMVEVGHGSYPVAYQQPQLTGDRRYIGAETWMVRRRDGLQGILAHAVTPRSVRNGTNITFVSDPINPLAELEAGIADEVVISNVFGDPLFEKSGIGTPQLLAEASRILKDTGIVVIRETRTPNKSRLAQAAIEAAGLKTLEKVHDIVSQQRIWRALEELFDGRPDVVQPAPSSLYRFLGKSAAA